MCHHNDILGKVFLDSNTKHSGRSTKPRRRPKVLEKIEFHKGSSRGKFTSTVLYDACVPPLKTWETPCVRGVAGQVTWSRTRQTASLKPPGP